MHRSSFSPWVSRSLSRSFVVSRPRSMSGRGDLQPRLAGSGNGCGDHSRRGKLRAGLVIAEVALSIVLPIAAGLVMRSFLILTRVDLGFSPRNILYFRLSLPTTYDHSREKQNMLTHQLLDRLRALPGVTSVAETSCNLR